MPGISCPKCQSEAPAPAQAGAAEMSCAVCGTRWEARIFPKLLNPSPPAVLAGETAEEGDAVCAFFPTLKAETVCDECGCLLSQRAAVSRAGTTLCLPCLHQAREGRGLPGWQAKRLLYDNLSLSLVTWLAPMGFFTAPLALYFLLRHRKDDRGLVPRGSLRWWAALALAVFWVLVWGALLVVFTLLMARALRQ